MVPITRESLSQDLHNLGIPQDAAIMMHSSLGSLGLVQGGAETVVDALLDTTGPKGTFVVPAFRDSVWGNPLDFAITDCCPCRNAFCPSTQKGFQGIIPETIRQRPGTLRSCHPTHSWVAMGPHAPDILMNHKYSPTPCGKGNPFESLVELDGYILLLGVLVNTITLWHYYEEILELPYMGHYWPKERHLNHCVGGNRIQYNYPGIMQDVCRASGILKTAPVGKSISGLMRAREFNEFMATIVSDDPYCFVLRPPNRKSADFAQDACQKAIAMLQAWHKRVSQAPKSMGFKPAPITPPDTNDVIRRDCPAFAGIFSALGKDIPLCRANGRHPDFFKAGGVFGECGLTTCSRCSWHLKFPPEN